MNNLQKLESKRLLKELDFYESDLEYKSELVNHVETTFIQSVNEYLDEHPTLKDVFDDVNIECIRDDEMNKKSDNDKMIEDTQANTQVIETDNTNGKKKKKKDREEAKEQEVKTDEETYTKLQSLLPICKN